MSHEETAPFSFNSDFLRVLSHRHALEVRQPGVAPTACDGLLQRRRHADPDDVHSPVILRCARCGDIVCLDAHSQAVLWIEHGMESAAEARATDMLFEDLLAVARNVVSSYEDTYYDTSEYTEEAHHEYFQALQAVAVADHRAEYLRRGPKPIVTLDLDDDPEFQLDPDEDIET
jgi:hypothetical protein